MAFTRKLREEIPTEEFTKEMMEVVWVTARRGNGDASVLVYAGHEETVKRYEKEWHAVIERLGDAAFAETGLSDRAITRAVRELYRHSPNCHPGHQGIDDATLAAEVRAVFDEYNVYNR